jgi:hypothetical protein
MLLTKVGKSDREGTFSEAHGNSEVAPKAAVGGGPVNVGYGTCTTLAQHLTRVGIGRIADTPLMPLSSVCWPTALGSNRFDEARVIILDVTDLRTDRPACHLFRG